MILPEDLIRHATTLLGSQDQRNDREVDLRRAVSAAYYAIFHVLCGDAARLVAPNVSEVVQQRIQRWFEHAQIRTLCGRLVKPQLDQPLADLMNPVPSPDLLFLAKSFIKLQGARHAADYDTSYSLDWDEARLTIEVAVRALAASRRLEGTSEANIFVLSLLVWKNWEKER